MHNASMMSHLSMDPAALAQSGIFNQLNASQYQGGMSDDRLQIIEWHLSQIAAVKEEVTEAEQHLSHTQAAVDRLKSQLNQKNREKYDIENEDFDAKRKEAQ